MTLQSGAITAKISGALMPKSDTRTSTDEKLPALPISILHTMTYAMTVHISNTTCNTMATKEEHSLTVAALEKMGEDHHYRATDAEQQAMLSVLEEHRQNAPKTVVGDYCAWPSAYVSIAA